LKRLVNLTDVEGSESWLTILNKGSSIIEALEFFQPPTELMHALSLYRVTACGTTQKLRGPPLEGFCIPSFKHQAMGRSGRMRVAMSVVPALVSPGKYPIYETAR